MYITNTRWRYNFIQFSVDKNIYIYIFHRATPLFRPTLSINNSATLPFTTKAMQICKTSALCRYAFDWNNPKPKKKKLRSYFCWLHANFDSWNTGHRTPRRTTYWHSNFRCNFLLFSKCHLLINHSKVPHRTSRRVALGKSVDDFI